MTDLMKKNLDEQIRMLKSQIQQCNDEKFDYFIHKYNIFNSIKNTIAEGIIETENYKDILEKDTLILDKIYNRFLDVNINAAIPTFDEVMLETFLEKEQEREEKLINIFIQEYLEYSEDSGMIPANSTLLQNYCLLDIYLLVDKGILQKRNCSGLAFEFTDHYIEEIKKKISRELNYDKCKRILSIDFSKIDDIEKLQKYKVELIDSNNYINNFRELGLTKESIRRGVIVQVPEISTNSYMPKDKYMVTNIEHAIEEINKRLNENLLKELEEDDELEE